MVSVLPMPKLRGIAIAAVMLCASHLAGAQASNGKFNASAQTSNLGDSDEFTIAKLMQAPAPELTAHPGDLLSVQVLEIDKYDYKVRVSTDGAISLPLTDSVSVVGKGTQAIAAQIRERLETLGMVHDPHIYVGILEQPSQVVTVAGDVEKPDTFLAPSVRTLLGAVSKAGGLKPTASNTVTLIRPGVAEYSIQLSPGATTQAGSIPVYAGDTIVVNKLGVIYVVGAVKLSGSFPLKSTGPTTAAQAVALAGNTGYEADLKGSRIVRRTPNGGTIEIPVDLRRLNEGSEHDPVLRANDILFIPSNAMKAALKGGGAGIAVTLASAAIFHY